MATSHSKILLNCWRDTTTTLLLLYFVLLILDVLIDGFVRAFVPLTVLGYLAVINVVLYQWWSRRGALHQRAHSTKV